MLQRTARLIARDARAARVVPRPARTFTTTRPTLAEVSMRLQARHNDR